MFFLLGQSCLSNTWLKRAGEEQRRGGRRCRYGRAGAALRVQRMRQALVRHQARRGLAQPVRLYRRVALHAAARRCRRGHFATRLLPASVARQRGRSPESAFPNRDWFAGRSGPGAGLRNSASMARVACKQRLAPFTISCVHSSQRMSQPPGSTVAAAQLPTRQG